MPSSKYTDFIERTLILKRQLVRQNIKSRTLDRKLLKWMRRSEKATVMKKFRINMTQIISELKWLSGCIHWSMPASVMWAFHYLRTVIANHDMNGKGALLFHSLCCFGKYRWPFIHDTWRLGSTTVIVQLANRPYTKAQKRKRAQKTMSLAQTLTI